MNTLKSLVLAIMLLFASITFSYSNPVITDNDIEYVDTISKDTTYTSIWEIEDYCKPLKVIQNGIVYIVIDGHKYTVNGILID